MVKVHKLMWFLLRYVGKLGMIIIYATLSVFLFDDVCTAVNLNAQNKICYVQCLQAFSRKHTSQFHKYTADGQLPKGDQDSSTATMMSFVGHTSSDACGARHPQQLKITKSLVESLIVACGLPMSLVGMPAFKDFIHGINPKFSLPSWQFVKYKALPEVAERKRVALQKLLDSSSHVALTHDIWTDRSCHSYLAVTAYTFVECNPQSGLLTFSAFSGSHTWDPDCRRD